MLEHELSKEGKDVYLNEVARKEKIKNGDKAYLLAWLYDDLSKNDKKFFRLTVASKVYKFTDHFEDIYKYVKTVIIVDVLMTILALILPYTLLSAIVGVLVIVLSILILLYLPLSYLTSILHLINKAYLCNGIPALEYELLSQKEYYESLYGKVSIEDEDFY